MISKLPATSGDAVVVDIKPTSDIFIVAFLSSPKNERILVAIINAILTDSGQERIVSATVLTPFNIRNYSVSKQLILDVRVRDEQNRFYNIEIQTYSHPAFNERILLGWADSFVSQIERGGNYSDLKIVFSLAVTEFVAFPESKKIHLEFTPREKDDHNLVLSNHFQAHFLQLGLLSQGHLELLEQVTTELAHWSVFLVFGNKSEVEMLQIAKKSTVVRDAFDNPIIRESITELQRFQADPKMREFERQHRLFLVDRQLRENAKKAEGMIEGEIKGKAEGKAEGIVDILSYKFGQVPQHIVDSLHKQTNLTTLNSLLIQATKCTSLDEFVDGL
jgi:predicted transposase/invertase (TIGR01784 family)